MKMTQHNPDSWADGEGQGKAKGEESEGKRRRREGGEGMISEGMEL